MPPSACSSKPTLPSVEMVRTQERRQPAAAGRRAATTSMTRRTSSSCSRRSWSWSRRRSSATPRRSSALMPMFATCDFDFGFAGAPGLAPHGPVAHDLPGDTTPPSAQYNSPIDIQNLQAAARTPFATAQKWFSTQLVNKVVSKLATTDDPAAPGTKVLDNTPHLRDERDRRRPGPHPRQRDPLPADARPACRWSRSARRRRAEDAGRSCSSRSTRTTRRRAVNRPAADIYLTMARAMGAANVTFPGQTGVLPGVLS